MPAPKAHGKLVSAKVEDLKPTRQIGASLQDAYDFFNKELFGGKLPACIILLHRKKNAHGYFWAENEVGLKNALEKLKKYADGKWLKISPLLEQLVTEGKGFASVEYSRPSRIPKLDRISSLGRTCSASCARIIAATGDVSRRAGAMSLRTLASSDTTILGSALARAGERQY